MTERFVRKQDCYLDIETGLEWSLDNIDPLSWKEAIEACKTLGYGWRLPSIEVLLTLVDYGKYGPATDLPKMVSSGYWSSTTPASLTGYAWSVGFNYGYDGWSYKSSDYYVRAVRGG